MHWLTLILASAFSVHNSSIETEAAATNIRMDLRTSLSSLFSYGDISLEGR
jgi:hypothetical protein